MPKLTLMPSGNSIEVSSDTDLLSALREQDVYIKSGCGGHASCTDCIIKVTAGAENLNEPTFEESQLLGNVFHITKERLSCQTKITGDVTIDISAHDKGKDQEKLRSKTSNFQKNKNVKLRRAGEKQTFPTPEPKEENKTPIDPRYKRMDGNRRPTVIKERKK